MQLDYTFYIFFLLVMNGFKELNITCLFLMLRISRQKFLTRFDINYIINSLANILLSTLFLNHFVETYKRVYGCCLGIKMTCEYIIYCDESEKSGVRYSNFYGGALVRLQDIREVIDRIDTKKLELNLYREVKWQKVTTSYLEKYCFLMDEFLDLVKADKVKLRVMFTQNDLQPQNLQSYHREHEYFILYYQFIKHAFGLRYSNESGSPIEIRIYFDKLPDTQEKSELFKDFVYGINCWPDFKKAKVQILRDQLAEVTSHKHVILQCLDVVLGAMQFRLNNKHKTKTAGSKRRGKRTIAKEKLYKHINNKVREIYPGFNIGITTGLQGNIANCWKHSYRHWLFRPSDAIIESNES